MKPLNGTGRHLIAAGNRAAYDVEAINIIKDKQYLAAILHECTTEFAGMDLENIIPCIQDPQVGIVPVEPGLTNTTVVGLPTESKVPGEGVLTYDIRFIAAKWDADAIEVRLNIDVEIQRDETPGYDLVPRGVLYAGRMLSEQMGHNVTGRNYDGLQKVYSIWICMSSALKRANTISRYSIKHETLHGEFEDTARSDLLQIIMVRLPDEALKGTPQNRPTPLMELLTVTFSEKIDLAEKMTRIQQMGIRLTEEIEVRLNTMCNLSEGILERGIKQGIEQGCNMVFDIMDRRTEFPSESVEETAKAVGCDPADVDMVISRVNRLWRIS